MPSSTLTGQIQALRVELETRNGRVTNAEHNIEKGNFIEVRERIAVLEHEVKKLEAVIEEYKPTREQVEEMGGLKTRIAQLEEQKKLGDTRLFQFILLFVGGVITLSVQIILLFFKK